MEVIYKEREKKRGQEGVGSSREHVGQMKNRELLISVK
jgi:hypothetical protein